MGAARKENELKGYDNRLLHDQVLLIPEICLFFKWTEMTICLFLSIFISHNTGLG